MLSINFVLITWFLGNSLRSLHDNDHVLNPLNSLDFENKSEDVNILELMNYINYGREYVYVYPNFSIDNVIYYTTGFIP